MGANFSLALVVMAIFTVFGICCGIGCIVSLLGYAMYGLVRKVYALVKR